MRWFSLRRGLSIGSKHITIRLPTELAQRLDDRAKLEDKTATDVIVEALEDLLSAPSVATEDSNVIRSARQVKQLEMEVERLEREEAYVQARKRVYLAQLKDGSGNDQLQWWNQEGEGGYMVGKEQARMGFYSYCGKRWRISPADHDQLLADKAVNDKIVADYEDRIRGLKDKAESLKAEIVKSDSNKS